MQDRELQLGIRQRRTAWCACLAVELLAACSATSSHKVLSILFDGVPEPGAQATSAGGKVAEEAAAPAPPTVFAHGPYADKQCDACHDRRANNGLVAPREELCQRCHDLQLDKAYVHGPLASGGCLACHDPHSSRFRYLLAAEPATFCVSCHDAAAVAASPAHGGDPGDCTACHDAHMSDQKFLLK